MNAKSLITIKCANPFIRNLLELTKFTMGIERLSRKKPDKNTGLKDSFNISDDN